MEKLLVLSLILSIFNIAKGDKIFNESTGSIFGVFTPLVEKISGYQDQLSVLNNKEVTEVFVNLTEQIGELALYHKKLFSNISTYDVKRTFQSFNDLFEPTLKEATQRIDFYSKKRDLSTNSEEEILKSINTIKGLFHEVIKDILSFNNVPHSSFYDAMRTSPTHLYALIHFCLHKEELGKFLPMDVVLDENIMSTLELVEFYLKETDPSLSGGSFKEFLEIFTKGQQSNQYNQQILHVFFEIHNNYKK